MCWSLICMPCTKIALRNQLLCDPQKFIFKVKKLFTVVTFESFLWSLNLCFIRVCYFNLFSIVNECHSAVVYFCNHKSLFNCCELLRDASCWNFNHFFSNAAFVLHCAFLNVSSNRTNYFVLQNIVIEHTGCVPSIHPVPISITNNS